MCVWHAYVFSVLIYSRGKEIYFFQDVCAKVKLTIFSDNLKLTFHLVLKKDSLILKVIVK